MTYDQQKKITDRVQANVRHFHAQRAPQASSKSMSPYLLANSFNFDVTEIMKEVKAAREKQMIYDKYDALNLK